MASKLNSDLEIEFKRSVIHKVKEYPVIWNLKTRLHGVWKTDIRAAWDDVQAAVDFPLRRLKLLWASFRRHYFDILMNKTINRDDTFPKWKLFHDLSFMYETVKKVIAEKLGGMSPPLFRPLRLADNGAPRVACPCCLPITTGNVSNSLEILVEAESLKTSPIEIYDLSDPEDFNEEQTINSFEGQSEESLCESNQIIILKQNSPSKLIETTSLQTPLNESSSNRFNQISVANETLLENGLYHIETNSLQTLLAESSIAQSKQTVLLQEQQQLSDNSFSQLTQSNFLQEQLPESSIHQSNRTSCSQEPLSENSLSQLIQSDCLQAPLSLTNANQFNQQIFFQEPQPENNQSNQTNILNRPVSEDTPIISNQTMFCQRKYTKRKRKAYTPREKLPGEREKIIYAIKPYPILYAKIPYRKGNLSQAWKNVAAEVGLPVHTVSNRWRLIKQRYVEEMMRERHSDKPFQSNWENFEQMSFMRELLQDDVDDMDRMRQEIHTLVKEKRGHQTIDLCSDDDVQNVILNNASVNKSTKRRSKKQPIDASQVDQSIRCDPPVLSKEQPEKIKISNVTTLIISSKEIENSDSPDTNKEPMNSYQQAFERSITSKRLDSTNDDIRCEQTIKKVQPNLAKRKQNKKSHVQVIELDLSSDEEDNVINVDDDESVAAESEVEMYAEISSEYICSSPEYATISSVYISSSPVNVPTTSTAANVTDPNNTICLDDDD